MRRKVMMEPDQDEAMMGKGKGAKMPMEPMMSVMMATTGPVKPTKKATPKKASSAQGAQKKTTKKPAKKK